MFLSQMDDEESDFVVGFFKFGNFSLKNPDLAV